MRTTERAVIYTRVSSDPHDTGRSVESQEEECRAYIARQGWTLVRVFEDNDRSASRHARKPRPSYLRLKDFLTAGGADVLVMWEGSRAQRDLRDFLALRDLCAERGVGYSYSGRLYDMNRTDDRFSTGLDALLAEREADVTRDRVLRGMRSSMAKGRPHGKLLYGYRREYANNGEYLRQVPHREQAAVVKEAARRVADGESCYAVAQDFNRRGISAPRGGQWDLTQIRRIVTNPGYVGQRVHQGKVVGKADWPAILDDKTFGVCLARMNDPRRKTVRDTTVKHLLTGAGTCDVCGAYLRVLKNRGIPSYICDKNFCIAVAVWKLDKFITDLVVARLSRRDALELLTADADDRDAIAAAREADELQNTLDEWYEAARKKKISPQGLAKIEAGLLEDIAAARARAQAVAVEPVLRSMIRPDLADVWEDFPIAARREVVSILLEIKVCRVGKGKRIFDPKRVALRWKRKAFAEPPEQQDQLADAAA
jgi:DNA invertase Pin-like site-specific DNA recombinase